MMSTPLAFQTRFLLNERTAGEFGGRTGKSLALRELQIPRERYFGSVGWCFPLNVQEVGYDPISQGSRHCGSGRDRS
jgi:hypothetical protein